MSSDLSVVAVEPKMEAEVEEGEGTFEKGLKVDEVVGSVVVVVVVSAFFVIGAARAKRSLDVLKSPNGILGFAKSLPSFFLSSF